MYAYVRQAVDSGEVVLEGGGADGRPSLKTRFAAERRKAKTLNFSIAYGKTARGLAADWGTTVEEAERTLAAWYSDRPEVREWQQRTVEEAHRSGYSRTLMGRYRLLRGINGRDRGMRGHMERAAINTPIQGGAADIVMQAMLSLHRQQRLRQLGWAMVLQIHDEIIAEGPQESAEEAVHIIADCMQHPFSRPLLVDLVVDAKSADTWYGAK
jgi:DNA polymerase-1